MKAPFAIGAVSLALTVFANPGLARAQERACGSSDPVNTIREMFSAIYACWVPPPGTAGMSVTLQFSLRRHGTLPGKPALPTPIWVVTKRLTGLLWRPSSKRSIRLCRYRFPIAWAEQLPVACSRPDLPQSLMMVHKPRPLPYRICHSSAGAKISNKPVSATYAPNGYFLHRPSQLTKVVGRQAWTPAIAQSPLGCEANGVALVLYEPKYDGFRCLALPRRRPGQSTVEKARSLNRFFPKVAADLVALGAG
jgi:hypothetical protein